MHTDSDLRVFLRWCTDQILEPLAAARVDIERYVGWLRDVRRYQPPTVSRRLSVVVGFYRVCIIDAILDHSPADYVRRPTVPAESPTLGLGHLQFEALITTARLSSNPNDFALVALLGLLGLRIFEACGSNIADLGEEHGHRVLRVRGKGGKVLVPFTKDRFDIDLDAQQVTCPNGVTAPIRTVRGHARHAGKADFGPACTTCPLRARCTAAKTGRSITIGHHEARLAAARTRQTDPAWRTDYRATRPKVERKIAHLMRRRHGGRRARMRGRLRVGAGFNLLAAAVNLARLATLGLAYTPHLGRALTTS